MTHLAATHVEIRPTLDGRPRTWIAGTRVRVQDIYVMADVQGKTADEIVAALPTLSLSQVHAALAYYFDHRQAILDELDEDQRAVRAHREMTGPGPLEARGDT